ncbi:MAG: gingipain R, partial [Candidatus Cloacimonetes bacterium]|nr:gingipain R [Candidatus Cloacimonadota bacterium]
MPRIITFVLCCLLLASLYGGEINHNQSSIPFSIVSRSQSEMNIQFSLPEHHLETKRDQGITWQRILMDQGIYQADAGVPDLPVLSFSIAIPVQGSVQVDLLRSSTRVVSDFIPYPSQDGLRNNDNQTFRINESYYQGRSNFPERVIDHSPPMVMRDLRIITVQVSPFIWDPGTRQLTIHDDMDIRVHFTSNPGENELSQSPTLISSLWAKQYEAMVLNFDDYRDVVIANTPPRYLVVHGNYVNTSFSEAIDSFVFWKKQKGADVDVVSTALTGTQNTQIKSYIQNQYNNPATRPDFIIFIGDTGGSFPIQTWSVSSGAGDYPYTHLAGTDGLGDCFIGRISANDNTQLMNLFNKIYLYEKNINLTSAAWLNRMLLVGDWSPSGISTVNISKYIKETALDINPNYTFTELYGSQPSASEMNNGINQGVAFFNYRGYINMSDWSPSESNLYNGSKTPHGVFITCATGNFDGTSTTESFLRLGSTASPKGGVTAIGM